MTHIFKKAAALSLGLLLLAGCGGQASAPTVEEQPLAVNAEQEVTALSAEAQDLTVWSVYWDCQEDASVLRSTADSYGAISLFAAYFQDGELAILDATSEMLAKIRNRDATQDKPVYLSVVNDVKNGDQSSLKDTDILWQLLGTPEAAAAHAQQLVDLAADNGFDGIEIDYEKIRKDMDLWQAFLQFEDTLLAKAKEKDLAVRILLEPSTPADQLTFPDGAEYVVMCYNLYGGGTDPGPKADYAFLQQMQEKFSTLPNISFALANGGYDWENGTTKAVQKRTSEAEALAEANGAEPQRDADSGALWFTYKDGGTTHTLWYADAETLSLWAKKLAECAGQKVRISLWRL